MRRIGIDELNELAPKKEAGPIMLPYRNEEGLTPALTHILLEVQRELGLHDADSEEEDTLDINKTLQDVALRTGFELSAYERDQILAQLDREARPFGVLQDLVDSPEVSDIIVHSASHIAFQSARSTHKTDLRFSSSEAYEAFVERILQRAGTTYSTKKPVADGMIGSFARIHAVHKSICESGPYLTIRLNRFGSVKLDDLATKGLAPVPVLKYLEKIVKGGQTLLLVGEVGTGKTTLARALAGAIPQRDSILVIEDTPEIRLSHPETRYLTTREANMDGEGRISPAYCIRAGMRMAMNRIVFGEIRDAEAAEAFIDVCASGHPGLSTLHAKSASDAIGRLELFLGRAQRGVGREVLSKQVSTAVQVIVFVNICHTTSRRRIMEVLEVGGLADGVLRQREMFRYQLRDDQPEWKVQSKSSQFRDLLETGADDLTLSSLPNVLELAPELNFREGMKAA